MSNAAQSPAGPALNRRAFLGGTLAASTLALLGPALHAAPGAAPHAAPGVAPGRGPALADATLAQLQEGMASGRWTAQAITRHYLARIEALDRRGPKLNAVIQVNPDALAQAKTLDAERKAGHVRGPLHGIPVLLKDNIDTADRMATTAGSLALAGVRAPGRDAFLVQQLRQAGAILLGKTNLSEWANMRSTHSVSGWSGRGGLTRNPYDLRRNTSGSSSGSGAAVAAGLCAAAVGTETDGSIVSPSSICGIVGIKPTVGLLSRAGIVPLSHTQDTPGPMARTVRDAALLLGAMTGPDPRDPATGAAAGHSHTDYLPFLDPAALKGARLGVVRNLFGENLQVNRLMAGTLKALEAQGAVLVDNLELSSAAYDDAETAVLLTDFRADFQAYMAERDPASPLKDLEAVIAFNDAHAAQELPHFGQELLLQAVKKGPLTDPAYRKALELCRAAASGLDALMAKHRLDALVAPTSGPAWMTDLVNGDHYGASCSTPAAVAGYPHITVPAGFVQGLPIGLSFFGGAWSEPRLLGLAYAFEQATPQRRAPKFQQP